MKVFYNLKNKGINANALQLIDSFLNNRRKRVALNGHSSSEQSARAGGFFSIK